MGATVWLVVNAVAVVCSVFAYVCFVWCNWRRGPFSTWNTRKKLGLLVALPALVVSLLVFVCYRLKYEIETTTQTGSFHGYALGPLDVYYPVPFRSRPNLEFVLREKPPFFVLGPKLTESRPDGFEVELDLNSWRYDWRATGIKSPQAGSMTHEVDPSQRTGIQVRQRINGISRNDKRRSSYGNAYQSDR